MADIIVVEDDERACRSLCRVLTLAGHDVRGVGSGLELDAALAQRSTEILLLDITLPDESGIDIARRLARDTDIRIIMVTAHGDIGTRIDAFRTGADHYLVKPIDIAELEAMIESLLRRRTAEMVRPEGDDWVLALASQRLTTPAGTSVELTASEFALLVCLMNEPGRVVPRETIAARLGYGHPIRSFNGIESVVARLRKKVVAETGIALPIKPARSIGYLFTAPAHTTG